MGLSIFIGDHIFPSTFLRHSIKEIEDGTFLEVLRLGNFTI